MQLDLRVDLKTVDLVRETAMATLREELGWRDCLVGLKRSDLWRFGGNADSVGEFRGCVEAEIARSGAFVNETKHRSRLDDGEVLGEGRMLDPAQLLSPDEIGRGRLWRALLWVTDEGGEVESLRRRAAVRFARGNLETLRRGQLWQLDIDASDEVAARAAVASMAITRSRREGLLLNPQYQEGCLLSLLPLEDPA